MKNENTDLTNSEWASLSQLKEHIEKHTPDETVVSFDGIYLITTKNTYGLGGNGLSIVPV
jgi:hypothetical protein|tara:strand:- start:1335 stop:1514 length:180 start_codon:yes stop_codon:yes gene_type:complete